MQKPLRVILEFPASAPFHRVLAAVREPCKDSLIMRPAVGLPDFDPDDEEQVALRNLLMQVGIPVEVPEPPATTEEQMNAEQVEREQLQAQWAAAQADGAAAAGQQQNGEYSEAYGAAGTPNPVLEHQSERLEHSAADVPDADQQQDDSGPAASGTSGDASVLDDLRGSTTTDQSE